MPLKVTNSSNLSIQTHQISCQIVLRPTSSCSMETQTTSPTQETNAHMSCVTQACMVSKNEAMTTRVLSILVMPRHYLSTIPKLFNDIMTSVVMYHV
jgi:hypothetical protein